jgi:hypothetical protein
MTEKRPIPIQKIRHIIPLFGMVLAITYLLGFVIVNLYLSKFGYATYELLRGRYLGAGMLYIFFSIVMFLPTGVSIGIGYMEGYEQGYEQSKLGVRMSINRFRRKSVIRMIGVGTSVIFIMAFSAKYILNIEPIKLSSLIWWIVDIVLISAMFVCLSDLLSHYVPWMLPLKQGKSTVVLSSQVVIIALIATIRIFAMEIYPIVGASAGGGKPIKAQVSLDSVSPIEISSDSLGAVNKRNPILDSVDIIFEDMNGLLVRYKLEGKEQVVLLKRDDVHWIRYLRGK